MSLKDQFSRQVAFSVLIGNGDMHLKNASLLYEDPLCPSLSPAYNLLSSRAYIPQSMLALSFGGSKEIEGLEPERMRRYARSAGLDPEPVAALVRVTAERTAVAWGDLPERDLLPRQMGVQISRHLEQALRRPLGGILA